MPCLFCLSVFRCLFGLRDVGKDLGVEFLASETSTIADIGMNSSSSETYLEKCLCSRTFTHPAAYKNHQNTCKVNEVRLSTVLENAREVLAVRNLAKKQRILDKLRPGLQVPGDLGETATVQETEVRAFLYPFRADSF